MKEIRVNLGSRSYDVTIGEGALDLAPEKMNLDRRVFIVTDSGVPLSYAEKIASFAKECKIYVIPEGEASKNIETFGNIISAMLSFGLTRSDCAVAVGGGVVGDITGFAASAYMRGIDFYNIPTTILSQVDSSIGGKTAIDHDGIKNIVGAFYQPSAVLIDTNVLETLDKRQRAAGLCEALKMAATSDAALFSIFERGEIEENLTDIIYRALKIKQKIVEEDERECGKRKLLNFGHTLGHAVEASAGGKLLHGECVAIGMLPMASEAVRKRLIPILKKLALPTKYDGDLEAMTRLISHDKKCSADKIDAVFVSEIGCGRYERISLDALREIIINYDRHEDRI